MAIVVWFLVVISSWLSGGMGTVDVGQVGGYPQFQSGVGVISGGVISDVDGSTICLDKPRPPIRVQEPTTWGEVKSLYLDR